MNIKVVSVNISNDKGDIKCPVELISLNEKGIVGDAHAGNWHRQISLLSKESIEEFGVKVGRTFKWGEFAENITVEGINLSDVSILDKFLIGDVELEVTQIGKKCHGDGCAIFQEMGKCVMPKNGLFCRVVNGGLIKMNDKIIYKPAPLKIKIITLSDRASSGEYTDRSGPKVKDLLNVHYTNSNLSADFTNIIIPDNADRLKDELSDVEEFDIIITTGGTGINSKDITPDVIKPMLDKEIPGIMEHIRIKYGEKIPSALLSRSIAGVINKTLIYTLPGSVKAVTEYMHEIQRTLDHAILTIKDINLH